MSLVKIKTKGQVTIPTTLCREVGLQVGDMLEITIKKGVLILTPKSVIDKSIAESLADFREGRSFGPFQNSKDLTVFLNKNSKSKRSRSQQ